MNILKQINDYMAENSGLDQHRDYLGISKIADCPRKVVLELRNGVTISEQAHRMCYAGYEHEAMVVKMLGDQVHDRGMEVRAPFDPMLKGHIDGTINGTLLEIKSVSTPKFNKVRETNRALTSHFIQVQLYMRYGGWKQASIIYRNRDTYEHFVISVAYDPRLASNYEDKARRILKHILDGTIPTCECGFCKEAA